jgi:GDPmannose 4,6-dehydratase
MFQITNVRTFAELGIQLEWRGTAENEKGIVSRIDNDQFLILNEKIPNSKASDLNSKSITQNSKLNSPLNIEHSTLDLQHLSLGDTIVSIDPNYYRPTEVDLLIGDPSKAKPCPPIFKAGKLGWEAETKLEELVKLMVESDFKKVVEKGY